MTKEEFLESKIQRMRRLINTLQGGLEYISGLHKGPPPPRLPDFIDDEYRMESYG